MSSKELHVIEKRQLVTLVNKKENIYESGFWPPSKMPEELVPKLVGGMIYLHETKSAKSWLGGLVLRYHTENENQQYLGRLVFTFKATREGQGARWKGRDDTMEWVGGIVDSAP